MKNREQGKSAPSGQKKLRLFFALWPTFDARTALHALARQCQKQYGGQAAREESIHLTLLFLGEVEAERLPQLQAAAATVQDGGFGLTLDRFTGWRHNGIGYAAPVEMPGELSDLVRRLRMAMLDAGFHFDQRAFTPHVTLLRKLAQVPEPQAITPISWQAHEFVLVQSAPEMGQVHYGVLGRWPLT